MTFYAQIQNVFVVYIMSDNQNLFDQEKQFFKQNKPVKLHKIVTLWHFIIKAVPPSLPPPRDIITCLRSSSRKIMSIIMSFYLIPFSTHSRPLLPFISPPVWDLHLGSSGRSIKNIFCPFPLPHPPPFSPPPTLHILTCLSSLSRKIIKSYISIFCPFPLPNFPFTPPPFSPPYPYLCKIFIQEDHKNSEEDGESTHETIDDAHEYINSDKHRLSLI